MVGEVLADRYELEELVGAGGMSNVFRAHDRVLERTVALKVLHQRLTEESEYVERFRREARMVAGLSHHNIVSVIDRGEHDGRPFIVFEFIDGDNLKQLVDRGGPLPVERALELAIGVARGLAFAHKSGFVHRDVKPQNVLVDGNGEAKVTDFGIARSLDMQPGVTLTGTVLGTSDYISPEQAQGRQVDEHTDIYSLGVVLYELLTGEPPFSGDNFVAVAMQHINEPVPPASLRRPEVPARVEAAIAKALAKEPADRFATMTQFCGELEECLEEVNSGADGSPTGVMPALPKPRRRHAPRRRRMKGRRLLVPALYAAAAAVAAIAVVVALDHGGGSGGKPGGASRAPIALAGTASYDPDGDGKEHPESVGLATDGSPATYWETEDYHSSLSDLGKAGVGLVLDAGAPVAPRALTVTTTTPGFTAVIEAGDSPTGPFQSVASPQVVSATTTFDLHGSKLRYYVVWITDLGPNSQVRVNEVTAR
jgi:predicted Ser/Thr protein kinase